MNSKKVLITGKTSYIGKNLAHWLGHSPDEYSVECISLKDEEWKDKDFSIYDVIVHVAGIAHVSTDPNMEELYYKVNRDLTLETAKKAKAEGVKQFIFLSSIIVYGDGSMDKKVIDGNTMPTPSNFYGDSKLQGEKGLKLLDSANFKVVIIRPPMIFGKFSKGNYSKLAKLPFILPFFPDYPNYRSMLHIDNLCEFIKLMIDNFEKGIFFPQNKEYVRTSEMVRMIGYVHKKNIHLTKIFNPIIRVLTSKVLVFNKLFGNLIYEKSLSEYKDNYQIRDFKESIELTELKRRRK
ncbi:NAD-dependent epimerase [Rossellomorea marisflavi]|uniref:NAD-dependent epimerase n=1 Tax=Rossellomorea marisflavi TaxID=189381 RepID=A0A0M0FZU1_9BACI|nr:NAD-dependent epimerase/dehydratase family protein [Rossellomorea marisflavi]KON82897.1 NAD-dependent epimerase [Rossellomorea marisflavi]